MSPWDEKMKEVPPQKQREGLMFYATVSRDPLFFPTVSIVRCFPVYVFFGEFQDPEIEGPFNPAASMISSWSPFIFTAEFLQKIRSAPGNHHDLGICRLWRTSE